MSDRLAGRVGRRVAAMAARFWADGGLDQTYPRNVERAAMLTLPICVVKLSSVTVARVQHWLAARGIAVRVPDDARDLMGCVICHRGQAILFACGSDAEDEIRITIAHELAHVLVHYFLRRDAAIAALGTQVVSVLDGDRLPTQSERTRAALAGLRLGPHAHLIPRNCLDARVDRAEAEADDLALELVAPRRAVDAQLRALPAAMLAEERRVALGRYFGVPSMWFRLVAPDEVMSRPTSFVGHILAESRRQS
jgi:hypothetical protein